MLFIPLGLGAKVKHAPRSFNFPDGRAVFVDFKEAIYNLTYNSNDKTVKSSAVITFQTDEEGMPVFDLVDRPTSVSVDGKTVSEKLISSPDGDTKFRVALKNLKPGKHTLEMTSSVLKNVNFFSTGVSSGFWYSDFDDRFLLEAYLPTNLEFDQYKMTFNIDFTNFKNQKLYTNGKVRKLTDSKFSIDFPETYTASSVYFHTDQNGKNPEKLFNFRSVNGRDIPVTIYSNGLDRGIDLEKTKIEVVQILNQLEKKYGPFLHSTLTLFNGGDNGVAMEYCGAAVFDSWSLGHEITHSYFARGGFMPADGNAGWVDEAIATWNDKGSPALESIDIKTNMAGHSEYRRFTENISNKQGSLFMSYLHFKFKDKGGLIPFLNSLILSSSWTPMTPPEFISKMSGFYGEDVTALFKQHVYSQDLK